MKILHPIGRFLTALLLSLLIVPTANNLIPDRSPAVASLPATLVAEINEHVAQLATTYGITTPSVHFLATKIAGVTLQNTADKKNGAADIQLGKPVQREIYQTHPELLKAIVSHELGHAVMDARNDEFPALLIIAMYGIGLMAILVCFPTIRGIALAASFITLSLVVLMLCPRWPNAHMAYVTFIFLVGIKAVLLIWIPPKKHLDENVVRYLTPHVPSVRTFVISAAIALPSFLIASWWIGAMNIERELRADVIGACAVSPEAMRNALLNLSDKPVSRWQDALDSFHPSMAERLAVLEELETPPVHQQACAAVLAGATPLTIRGHTIQ
jgi:hypothetical protein